MSIAVRRQARVAPRGNNVAKPMGATTALAKLFTADALMAAVNELLSADA